MPGARWLAACLYQLLNEGESLETAWPRQKLSADLHVTALLVNSLKAELREDFEEFVPRQRSKLGHELEVRVRRRQAPMADPPVQVQRDPRHAGEG